MKTFSSQVYDIIAAIPRGKVVSYGQIAAVLGRPRAAREVGWAMRNCPEYLPWQRVVMADGAVTGGQYAAARRAALEDEGVHFLPDGRVDMKKYRAGLSARTIEVVEYDPSWPSQFAAHAAALKDIFGKTALNIEHFGSTAVPGLAAKPTIDILVFAEDMAIVDSLNSKMAAAGYQPHGEYGIAGRRYFVAYDATGRHVCHVHVYETGHTSAQNDLLFRDILRNDESARKKYGELKQALSQIHNADPAEYNKGKTECVLEIRE